MVPMLLGALMPGSPQNELLLRVVEVGAGDCNSVLVLLREMSNWTDALGMRVLAVRVVCRALKLKD